MVSYCLLTLTTYFTWNYINNFLCVIEKYFRHIHSFLCDYVNSIYYVLCTEIGKSEWRPAIKYLNFKWLSPPPTLRPLIRFIKGKLMHTRPLLMQPLCNSNSPFSSPDFFIRSFTRAVNALNFHFDSLLISMMNYSDVLMLRLFFSMCKKMRRCHIIISLVECQNWRNCHHF